MGNELPDTQPAGEHHTGTLNLAGEGNTPQASPITDEAIKAACGGWATTPHYGTANGLRDAMRAALEAAYPAIRQHVAEQIAVKADAIAEEYQATATTHRDISHNNGSTSRKGVSHMNTAHAYRNKADGAWAVAHAAREIGCGA